MFKKILFIAAIICLLFMVLSCPPDNTPCLTEEMEEYGYSVYFVCLVLAGFEAPGSEIVEVGDVSTITFTDMEYIDDENATVSGTVVYDSGASPETEVGDLTFSNDPQGLESIETDMEYENEQYTGEFTINDCNDSSAEAYQEYIESQLE